MAVVAALELEDPVARVNAPRDADRAHRRLGARRDEPHHLDRRDGVDDLLRQLDLALGRRAEARPVARGLAIGLDRLGVRVPEEERAPRHHPVDVAPAVDVLEVRALAARDEERLVDADGAPSREPAS